MRVGYGSINPIPYILGDRRPPGHIVQHLGVWNEITHLGSPRLYASVTYLEHLTSPSDYR